jgi:hypothetical protein
MLQNVFIDVSYDSACSYSINAKTRFGEHFPAQLKDYITRTRFTIDSLHVHDHIPKCMYLFSTNYQDGIGHFHGVGTEQYWAEQNQMCAQTRQMNPGYRHDRATSHHEDWNKKKTNRHGMYIPYEHP